MSGFYIIKHSATAETESKKSRFLAFLKPVENKESAMCHLQQIKTAHPDAAHHCWAYIIGSPRNSGIMGMSDDHEPHNTAGRPMLSLLQNRSIGNIAAVVVRYWGGTKLGTGGLVRAYSGAVQAALENAEIIEKVETRKLRFKVDFAAEAAIRRKIETMQVFESTISYSEGVIFSLAVPEKEISTIYKAISNTVNGRIEPLAENGDV
ncbi:YigZ family protein [Lentisphaerota bacterium ZTH]|nr:YigZ family protein [Lentisphaerota bacterium]WET06124.1 YigZ family protein [Lentisphaerota bacterium ZTH]